MQRPENSSVPATAEVRQQVERILASRTFSGAEAMRHLLAWLARHAEECPGQIPKEHEIAVGLLGRPSDFDPKIDPVVRVQASRLRSKLAEYYVAEGASDDIYIDVPKGTYSLHATHRLTQLAANTPSGHTSAARSATRLVHWLLAGLGAAAVIAAAALAAWNLRAPAPDARLVQFWRPFLESAQEPLVVFANPKFVGSSSSSLHLFDPLKDQASAVNPGYSGVGEVMGAGALVRLFTRLGRPVRLKPSQLFSWDDANAHNLIFMGAPPHNVPLYKVPLGRRLRFKPYGQEPREDEGCVQNLRPNSGEQDLYCTSVEGPTWTEYAIVTLSPGTDRSRMVLFAAGTTTFGTQASVEFLCDPERVTAIARLLGVDPRRDLPPFEALLRCRVRSSVPVDAEIVLAGK